MSTISSASHRVTSARVLMAIAGIYISQTIVTALATQALPSLLRSEGASLTVAGLTALLWVPWGIRFLWAPWIERRRLPLGRPERRSCALVLAGQWIMAAILAGMGLAGWMSHAPLGSFAVRLLGSLLLVALVSASTDVACDGFTVEQLAGKWRGWGNVVQVGGSYVGAMLGAGGFLLVADKAGWPVALVAVSLAIVLLGLPMLLLREPPRDAALDMDHRPSLLNALRRSQVRMGLLLMLLSSIGVRLTLGMFGPFLLDKGLSLEQLGWLFGSLHIGAGLTGAMLGGLLVRAAPGWRAVWIAVSLEALVLITLTWVALYSALMNLTSPLQAGVDFTVFQSADALLAMAGGVAGGWLAEHLGYYFCFGLAAGLSIVAAVLVRHHARLEQAVPSSSQGAVHVG